MVLKYDKDRIGKGNWEFHEDGSPHVSQGSDSWFYDRDATIEQMQTYCRDFSKGPGVFHWRQWARVGRGMEQVSMKQIAIGARNES
jgi:hypothetical protein